MVGVECSPLGRFNNKPSRSPWGQAARRAVLLGVLAAGSSSFAQTPLPLVAAIDEANSLAAITAGDQLLRHMNSRLWRVGRSHYRLPSSPDSNAMSPVQLEQFRLVLNAAQLSGGLDSNGNQLGMDYDGEVVTLGVESGQESQSQLYGIALSMATVSADIDQQVGQLDSENFALTAYAMQSFGYFVFDQQLFLAQQDFDYSRYDTAANAVIRGQTDVSVLGLSLRAALPIDVDRGSVGPFLALQHTQLEYDDFSERGDGAATQQVSLGDSQRSILSMGLHVAQAHETSIGPMESRLSFAYSRRVGYSKPSPQVQPTAAATGVLTTSWSAEDDRSFVVDAGVTVEAGRRTQYSLSYQWALFGEGYERHALLGQVDYAF